MASGNAHDSKTDTERRYWEGEYSYLLSWRYRRSLVPNRLWFRRTQDRDAFAGTVIKAGGSILPDDEIQGGYRASAQHWG